MSSVKIQINLSSALFFMLNTVPPWSQTYYFSVGYTYSHLYAILQDVHFDKILIAAFQNHIYLFSSVTQQCPTLHDPMDHIKPGLPVHHQLPEFTQTHLHWVGDATQPSHRLSSPSPPALNLSQHQGLFKWVSSSHEVAKMLEFQLQHQSFQWTPRSDLL